MQTQREATTGNTFPCVIWVHALLRSFQQSAVDERIATDGLMERF